MMRDFGTIFEVEFLRRVRSRAYIFGTLIGVLAIVLVTALPSLLGNAFRGSANQLIIAGEPALTAPAKKLLAKDFDVIATRSIPQTTPTLADLDGPQKASAFVIITRGNQGLDLTAFARDPGQFSDTTLKRDLIPLNIALATHLEERAIAPMLKVSLHVRSLDTKFKDESSANAARGGALALVFLLYLAILLNSQSVLSSVAEEKTSRIAELLVATTSPAQLLAGKIIATGVTGFIQIAIWAVGGIAASSYLLGRVGASTSSAAREGIDFSSIDISTSTIIAFAIFFVIGFLQYATVYAAAASLISRTEDLGSVAAPLVLPVVGAFIFAQWAITVPNSTSVAIVSQIPLVAPFVMFSRLAVATVPLWQVILSIAINLAATVLIIWGAGKVYRVGLLLYGRLPKFSQVIAALRA
jgi:ABC-2 type transport system permease protein